MSNPNIGFATLSVIPSMKGIDSRLRVGLTSPLAKASSDAGDKSGSGFLSSFTGAAKAGAVGAGVLIGGLLAKGFNDALGNEVSNDKFAAQLGLPPDRAKELGKVSGALYAGAYGDSLGTVNDALKSVLQSGAVTEDIDDGSLQALTAKALDLGTAFDQDVGAPAKAAGQLIRTGLAANADEAFDIITRGFQEGADKGDDFIDTLNEYGTQFRKLGLTGAGATGLIAQGLAAGARDSDVVADALKEFSIRAVDGSKLTADGFKSVGLNAKQMSADIAAGGPRASKALDLTLDRLRGIEDPVKRSQAAVALFGTQAEDLGDALFALDPSQAVARLGNVEGAAARLGTTLNDNAASKIESFKRGALQGLTNFIGGTVIPGAEKLVSIFQEEGVGGIAQRAGAAIQAGTPVVIEGLKNLLGAGVDWITADGLPLLGEGFRKLVPAASGWIAGDAVPAIVKALPGILAAVGEWAINDAIPALAQLGFDLSAGLIGAFVEQAKGLGGLGLDIGKSLVNGIIGLLNSQVVDRINDLLEIHINVPLGPDIDIDPPDLGHIPKLRARGGPVTAGMPYIVGDRFGLSRAELFVPDRNGTILPRIPDGSDIGGGSITGPFRDLTIVGQLGEDPVKRAFHEARKMAMVA